MDTTQKRKFLTKISKKVGKAIFDYGMISDGDKVLVCLSGGKDSWTLMDILLEKYRSFPIKFSLEAIHIDFGFHQQQIDIPIKKYLTSTNIPFHFIRKPLPTTDKNINCFWCSWNRRKEIFLLAGKLKFNKIALGHNQDDIVETFLMNLFYHGEISTMPAKLEMFKGEFHVIRPLVYVTAEETKKYAELKKLPVIECNCPYYNSEENFSYRKYIRKMVSELEKHNKLIKINIFNSIKRIKQEYLV